MRTIYKQMFPGTTAQLQARLQAFNDALEAHRLTEGVPAPRELDFVEDLARTGESFEVEEPPPPPPPPPPPTPQQLAAAARGAAFDTAIGGDATIQQLKTMSNAEFDAWWDANVTSAALAIALLKRLTRVIIRRVL